MKPNSHGYVYLAKFDLLTGCYKIGSTSNLEQRRKYLEYLHGNTCFLLVGEVPNKLKCEKKIQSMLYRCSNRAVFSDKVPRNSTDADILKIIPTAYFFSEEYFQFDEVELGCAMVLFQSVCKNTEVMKTKYLNGWGEI